MNEPNKANPAFAVVNMYLRKDFIFCLEIRYIILRTLEKGRKFLKHQTFNSILYFLSEKKNDKGFNLFLTNADEQ